ncbi:hypothetical protein FIBSPDRAFT_926867, partial [Athelia psychrophila]
MTSKSPDPRPEYGNYTHMSVKDHFLGASQTIVTLVKEVSDLIPNAGPLAQVLGITGAVFEIINQIKTNKDDCVLLVERILRFLKDMAEECKLLDAPIVDGSATARRLDNLISKIDLIKKDAETWQESSRWDALWHRDTLKDALLKHNTNLTDCFHAFNTGALLHLTARADNSTHQMILPTGLAPGHLFTGLVVLEAMHSYKGPRRSCLKGTRQAVIDKFFEWKESGVTHVCWFSGPAGFGKSAISQSIAELCASEGILAATFFFLRGAGARSDFNYLITTLAYQLTLSIPATKPAIESALREDVRIDSQSMEDQLEKLIIQPLKALAGHSTTPSVIIIDALDECNDHAKIGTFIDIVARACSSRQLPVRLLLTSRREDHIIRAFSSAVATAATTELSLESFDASKDIEAYLQSRFSEILQQNRHI